MRPFFGKYNVKIITYKFTNIKITVNKTKRIYDEDDSDRIKDVCVRLQRSVTEIQIINWLENFDDNEIDLALTVLDSIRYYSVEDMIYDFDEGLKKILDQIDPKEKIYVHGLGDFGKSGSSLIYYITKTPTFKNNPDRFKILSHIKKIKQQGLKNGGYILLVDDIIGSGNSLIKYYNHNIKQQLASEKIEISTIVLCLAYMIDCTKNLNKSISNLKIFGTPYHKAFSSDSSVFGYRPKMLPVRNFCYKYGVDLFSVYDPELKKVVTHPLGYNKSQSLLAFAHSVPNNTLPIIWSNANQWQPLFPRNSIARIAKAKNFRNETRLWLIKAYQLLIFNSRIDNKIYFKDLDYKILAVIRLKKRGSAEPIICQILGISINELDEIYNEGIKFNLFDLDGRLTTKAQEIYQQIKQKISISNTEEKRKFNKLRSNTIYVPKTFLRKT